MSILTTADPAALRTDPPTGHRLRAYPPRNRRKPLRDWLFKVIHGNKLVYNTCWEDPRCDRELLQLNHDSELVMITSAGCNALEYLLDAPRRVHCIDVNPRQNALLQLKKAALLELDHPTFFRCFGEGREEEFKTHYTQKLRRWLPAESRAYWDGRLSYFSPKPGRAGLYFHGSSGYFAWTANRLLRRKPRLYADIRQLFEAATPTEQRERYFAIEEEVLDVLVGGPIRQRVSLSLVGVPAAQRSLIEQCPDGLRGYIRAAFRHIFTELPIQDNYFYRLYLNGGYTPDCCPEYLKRENLAGLRRQLHTLHTHTTTVADFLRTHPGTYSHFVLLDHQDWLAAHAPAALLEEWELILANSRPGTRILLRSASPDPDVVPDFVRERVRFLPELTAHQARLDRVGTYAGCFLLEVKTPTPTP